MLDIYGERVAALRVEYECDLLALEEAAAARWAGEMARVPSISSGRAGDGAQMREAIHRYAARSRLEASESRYVDERDALVARFYDRCADVRKELGL